MSADLDHELELLATADRHIADAEQSLSHQMSLIEQMREKGEDPSAYKAVLARIDRTLLEWRTQRDIIIDRIKGFDDHAR